METILTKFNKISFFCNDESGENNFPILWIRNCIKWGSRSIEGDMLTLLVYAQASADSPYIHMPVFCSRRTKNSVYVSDNGWILSCFEGNDQKKIVAFLDEKDRKNFNEDGVLGAYVDPGLSNCMLIYHLIFLVAKIDNIAERLNIHTLPREKPFEIVNNAADDAYIAENLYEDLKDGFVFVGENGKVILVSYNGKKTFLVARKEKFAEKFKAELIEKGVKCHLAKIRNFELLIRICFIYADVEQIVVVSHPNSECYTGKDFFGWDMKHLSARITASS